MAASSLKNIRIILVEPAGALNVGSVARAMKNMGLEQLILVSPHCDRNSEEARQMAVHAGDILAGARIVESLSEALQGCHRAIATTARNRKRPLPLESPKTVLPWLLEDKTLTSALIFGPEDRGLNNQELSLAQRYLEIPANPEYSSLNLAQAVVVCAYELYQLTLSPPSPSLPITPSPHHPLTPSPSLPITPSPHHPLTPSPSHPLTPSPPHSLPATLDSLENYYQHLERVLLAIGYLYPHTATARMEKFRHLFHRAALSSEEVALLRGILRQMEWAMESGSQKR
ncbi:TrmJ/YjtD family RNA methyltransferase [Oscillatoria sp. FACHB-1406]|uniref:TrmJ/YjtD family RNA methyltransferase n=1 Tax=Oscillatoria sp. FACHB-1406 TaxID=2692846 RepID=UPI001688698E|nr:TrmJ/YjtD family RNA methyltransferase [Oscillatoria sp. FACHB-1406]MBD2577749.1 TrmJ/YjtD family RNA methyltransferase [Oscillatoria sp. FACHB-1406]